MLKKQFIEELRTNSLMLHTSGYPSVDYIANEILRGTLKADVQPYVATSHTGELIDFTDDDDDSDGNPFDTWQRDSIAVIPIIGTMMKYDYWWSYGMDRIASIIQMAYASDNVAGVVVNFDTPGGATDSLYYLQEVLQNKTKPTYGFISGMCASCGYITASYLDKVYAINDMASVGGIGVYARLIVPKAENDYYKVVEVYPDESSEKNKEMRDAAAGKPEAMKEELSKLAVYIQNTVKANRPAIAEETMKGKTYYAYEAVGLGMIDGVKPFADVVAEMQTLTTKRNQLISNL